MTDERPDESWDSERLGEYCLRGQKRLAIEVWRFGHALNLAKAKQSHGQWKVWKQTYAPHLTKSSEHRYRQLAERLTEGSLEGIGLAEAYRILDLTYEDKKPKGGRDTTADTTAVSHAEGQAQYATLPWERESEHGLPVAEPFLCQPPVTSQAEGVAELPPPRLAVAEDPQEEGGEKPPSLPPGVVIGPDPDWERFCAEGNADQHVRLPAGASIGPDLEWIQDVRREQCNDFLTSCRESRSKLRAFGQRLATQDAEARLTMSREFCLAAILQEFVQDLEDLRRLVNSSEGYEG